jgi:hypothetical protein
MASRLELPTTAGRAELRQMVEGKLEDDREDPMDVQVVLAETDTGRRGTFLTMEPEAKTTTFTDEVSGLKGELERERQ